MLPQREKGLYAKILKFTIASTIPTSRTTKDCFCCGEEHVTKRALQNANYKLGFGHHFLSSMHLSKFTYPCVL